MRFEHPNVLWLMAAAVPGLAVFFVWVWRTKRRLIAQFVQSRLLAQLTVGVSARRQQARMGMMVAAIGLLAMVLARPQWGYQYEEARRRGLDIVVAIDTSRSMLAGDLPPNRLERAKLAALDLMGLARSDRLGLVAFAGGAFLQCPLTVDDTAFRQSMDGLTTAVIPQGGTALAEAIRAAQSAFDKNHDNFKVLVLFTDGEDHDGHAVEAARQAAREGMRIFAVGVGTPGGELIRIPNGQGGTDFLKDESGQVVKSRLDEALLKRIAEAGLGFQILLGGANSMELLYERGLAPLPKAEYSARQVRRYHERYQWFLSLALVLLFIEMLLPDQKRAVKRGEPAGGASPLARAGASGLALALLALGLSAGTMEAAGGRALKAYRAGNFPAARLGYERLMNKRPEDSRLHFNVGATAYQAADYEAAEEQFQASLASPDLTLQQGAYYNLGNTRFRIGEETSDLKTRQAAWEQAVTHYESALQLNAQDQDAQFNLDLVQKKLEELKQQQEQQQKNQPQDQPQDKSEEEKDAQDNQDGSSEQKPPPQEKQSGGEETPRKEQQPPPPKDPAGEQKDGGSPQESKEEEGNPAEAGEGKPEEGEGQETLPSGQTTPFRMSIEQARRLLDGMKGEERALIFLPQTFTNRSTRVNKNW